MDDQGETRDDLRHTDLCTPSKVDDIKTMVANAEDNGQDVLVINCIYIIVLTLLASITFALHADRNH